MPSDKFIKRADRKGGNRKSFPKSPSGQNKNQRPSDPERKPNRRGKRKRKIPETEHQKAEKLEKEGTTPTDVENGNLEPEVEFNAEAPKKKSKHKRRKITDEKNLEEKVTIERLNNDLKKHYEHRLRHKLSALEIAEHNFTASHSDKFFNFIEGEESLEDFLARSDVSLKNSIEPSQTFNVITISSSAIRCVDLKRIVLPQPDVKNLIEEVKKDIKTDKSKEPKIQVKIKPTHKILKLFGKHMKLNEQVKLINDNVKKGVNYDICFATISRLIKLIEEKCIDLDNTTLFIDYNFRNKKYKRLIDEKESADVFANFLLKVVKPSLESKNLKVLFF